MSLLTYSLYVLDKSNFSHEYKYLFSYIEVSTIILN